MEKLSKQKLALLIKEIPRLKPIVIVGEKGITDNLINETLLSLTAHELIKVKINIGERDERKELAQQLANACDAEIIQIVGRVVVLYRENKV